MKKYATRECKDQESHSLLIETQEENDFFANRAETKNWRSFWLVINDARIEGQWVKPEKWGGYGSKSRAWIDFGFTNFADEPNDILPDEEENSAIFIVGGE